MSRKMKKRQETIKSEPTKENSIESKGIEENSALKNVKDNIVMQGDIEDLNIYVSFDYISEQFQISEEDIKASLDSKMVIKFMRNGKKRKYVELINLLSLKANTNYYSIFSMVLNIYKNKDIDFALHGMRDALSEISKLTGKDQEFTEKICNCDQETEVIINKLKKDFNGESAKRIKHIREERRKYKIYKILSDMLYEVITPRGIDTLNESLDRAYESLKGFRKEA